MYSDNVNILSTKEDEKVIYSKRKVSFKLPLLLTLVLLLTGCSKLSNLNEKDNTSELTVPSYNSIDEYMSWAEKNKVKIRLIDSEGGIVDREEKGAILEVTPESLLTRETLEIVVCKKEVTCLLLIENDPMEILKRK